MLTLTTFENVTIICRMNVRHATSTSTVPHPWLSFVLRAASNFRRVHLRRDQTMLQVSAMVKRARWLERKYVGRLRLEHHIDVDVER